LGIPGGGGAAPLKRGGVLGGAYLRRAEGVERWQFHDEKEDPNLKTAVLKLKKGVREGENKREP